MFIILMQGRSSPERVEFISVTVCQRSSYPIRDLLKGFALSKFDRKIFPSYSVLSSALYVSVPGYYFSIILIDFFKLYKELKFLLFQRSVVGTSD